MKIHPTALVSPSAQLAEDVEIGAFACIGDEVEIGARTVVQAHAVLDGLVRLGEENFVGFGAIKPRPMAVGSEVRLRPSCWISLSADHRIVDGAAAAQFMGVLMNALEHPDTLV